MTTLAHYPNPSSDENRNNNTEIDRQHAMTCRLRDTGWWWAIIYPSLAGYWHIFTRKTITPVATGLGGFVLGMILAISLAEPVCGKDKDCTGLLAVTMFLTYIPGVKAGIEIDRRNAEKYFSNLRNK